MTIVLSELSPEVDKSILTRKVVGREECPTSYTS